ncbi:MAG: universal stress protein [Bryobacteraceae bacterium]
MTTFKHILFPVDFSDRCNGATPFVENMAHKCGARVTLLAIAHPVYAGGLAGAAVVAPQEMLAAVKTQLDSHFANSFARLRVERVAEIGEPAQVITDYAMAHEVDLVMMPTHGYGPFRQLLLGSTTAKVLHDLARPVWTTAHKGDAPDRAHLEPQNLLCAIDGSLHSAGVMQSAAALATELGASLRFVHVVPGIEAWPERQMDVELEEEMRLAAKQNIESMAASLGIDAPVCIRAGTVADGVAEEASRHGSDLLLIGRGKMQDTLGRLRTHAYGIIRLSPCPVLSF